MLALGVSAGSILWGILTGVGLTALLATYASFLAAVKIAGGLYLLWLAFKALRSAASPGKVHTVSLSTRERPLRYFLRGLTVQMTNPKAAGTWVAIMSVGVQADAPWWVTLAIVVGTGLLSVAGHAIYAIAFSTKHMGSLYGRSRRWIELALGAFLGFVGVKLLTSRI
jgi:amino acid exporter